MKLCVGATSRLVVEEAARAKVPQIIASRRQVNADGGYTGLTSDALVRLVRLNSGGATKVIRDHGGPGMDGTPVDKDPWEEQLENDIAVGFDGLHIDVCKLPPTAQADTLVATINRFVGAGVTIEIGGERDPWVHNLMLLEAVINRTPVIPSYTVIDLGGYALNDRQCGLLRGRDEVAAATSELHAYGTKSKAHNMDWVGRRVARYYGVLDAYNIAPELGDLEARAWLEVMDYDDVNACLRIAFRSRWWERWFQPTDGTWHDKAMCAFRYCMDVQSNPEIALILGKYRDYESHVRGVVHDAIVTG